jgi:hypothetical protein
MPKLTNQSHEAFAQSFAARRHFGEAAALAGSKADNLSQAGAQIYARPEVKARVRELADKITKPLRMDAQRLITEIARMSSVDYRRFHHEDGTQKGPHELDDDEAACVRGVDRNGRYQFWDKNPPVQLLAKHYKLVGDEGDGVNALASALADRLKTARQRVSAPAPRIVDSTPTDNQEDLA